MNSFVEMWIESAVKPNIKARKKCKDNVIPRLESKINPIWDTTQPTQSRPIHYYYYYFDSLSIRLLCSNRFAVVNSFDSFIDFKRFLGGPLFITFAVVGLDRLLLITSSSSVDSSPDALSVFSDLESESSIELDDCSVDGCDDELFEEASDTCFDVKF